MFLWSVIQNAQDKGPLHMRKSVKQRFAELKPLILSVSNGNRFLASVIAGIVWTESEFLSTAVNPSSGASGLMQIMPFHFAAYGIESGKWRDPKRNLEVGLSILRNHGLGIEPLRNVLAEYGGFVTQDSKVYVNLVLERSSFLFPQFLFASIKGV